MLRTLLLWWKNMNVANASSLVWRGWRRVYGLQVAQREIPKYNSRILEWYLKTLNSKLWLSHMTLPLYLKTSLKSYLRWRLGLLYSSYFISTSAPSSTPSSYYSPPPSPTSTTFWSLMYHRQQRANHFLFLRTYL